MLESVPVLLESVSSVFGIIQLMKVGKLIYLKGKIYGVHIRYVKIRRTKPLNGSKLNNLVS